MKNITIKTIEVTLFEITIPDIVGDPSGFGFWYQRGAGTPQQRFALKIYADDGTIGEYVPHAPAHRWLWPPALPWGTY